MAYRVLNSARVTYLDYVQAKKKKPLAGLAFY